MKLIFVFYILFPQRVIKRQLFAFIFEFFYIKPQLRLNYQTFHITKNVKIGPTVRPERTTEKKGQDSQKSHKGVIFHLLERSLH